MKRSPLTIAIVIGLVSIAFGAGGPANFTGEYADKKYMNGQAILQLSLEQTGNNVSIFYSGVRNDGQGAAPEINATGVVSGGSVQFKFQDDLKNAGTGTITRAGDDMVVSIKATKVVDPRCLQFYKQGLRLKRVKK
jgi:hypothetical protein